jgi:uncharacterized phiE125 gp8 family phage protein|tara:strand:+ start:1210 stop:1887 length:678 start_codon:yes stop_codon:yes gene_type:complete
MAGLQVHTAETAYAVTQAEIKAWNKIDSTDDDTAVALIERAVHNWAKEYTGRTLTTVTYNLFIDSVYDYDIPIHEGFYTGYDSHVYKRSIALPKSPVSSVTHIKYYDDSDNASTFATTNYFVDNASVPAKIVLRKGASYPSSLRVANGIEIKYVAGYGATTAVPYDIKSACLAYSAYLFEHRGDLLDGKRVLAPTSATQLLEAYKIKDVGVHPYRGVAQFGGLFG